MPYILLILGFILLIKGADTFVDGASNIAKKFGIPSIIVGLTIVSIGTSAPELSVSITSALKGANEIAFGNVLGSNIFNILVVVGVVASIYPITIEKKTIKRDFLVTIVATLTLFVLTFIIKPTGVSRFSGVVLFLMCISYIAYLIKVSLNSKEDSTDENEIKERKEIKIITCIIKSVLGVIAIIIGGDLVVNSAQTIALGFGMNEKLVGLTIIAIGTSLPELVTSMVAAFKGKTELAIGNVLGSCIFNILLILGVSCSISPILVGQALMFDILVALGSLLLLGLFIFINKGKNGVVKRYQGIILVLIYASYMCYIIIRN